MTIREVTISKLQSLPEPLLSEVNQFIDKLQLRQAAQEALEDYQNDPELTVFSCLDGTDFYDENIHAKR
ncbi:MAG: hypothetical protein NW237_00495 [Cyanobacteriota bacterium]|nr:hypothetical protein [Cyanobacteriota bacterium]